MGMKVSLGSDAEDARERLLKALGILATLPALRQDEAEAYAHIFQDAREAALESGDKGREIRDKLYDVLAYSQNGLVQVYAVRALGDVLLKSPDADTQREIIAGITETAGGARGPVREIKSVFSAFAEKEPESWYGGLSGVFARTAKQNNAIILLNAVNEQVWNTVGAQQLEELGPTSAPWLKP